MTNGNRAAGEISAIQSKLAANGGRHIGDLTAWNAESIDVPRDDVTAVFAAENLGSCVPGLEIGSALYRASHEVRPSKDSGLRVLPFAKPNADTPTALGVYVVAGKGECGDGYVCGARVRIDLKAGQAVALPPEDGAPVEACIAHAEAVAATANHLLTHAQTRDVSAAMVRALASLSAVPLRDRGGFYLLPPASTPVWRRLAAALKGLGVDPICIEMHDSPGNVVEAGRAAKGALEQDVRELLEELQKAASEGLGKRALANRMRECRELAARAELFRDVLCGITDEIASKCEAMRQSFQKALDEERLDDEDLFRVPVVEESIAEPIAAE